MNSAQIKAALKLSMDLAPAIMRAGEIVEAAEQAETVLSELAVKKKAAEDEIQSIKDQAASHRTEMEAVAKDLADAKKAAQAEKDKLNKHLGAIQEKIETANQALDKTRADHAAFMQQADAERILKQSELDGVKRELEAVLNRLRG